MKHQSFPLSVKSLDGSGQFEGALAVYNNVDLGGDLIEPGAFTKSIKDRGHQVPLLWQHKSDEPIGMLTLIDTPTSLNVKGQLIMELPMAQKAHVLIKHRVVKGLSIGFDTVKDTMTNGVRHLKELKLWEGSIVTFPMNTSATIWAAKDLLSQVRPDSVRPGERAELLSELRRLSGAPGNDESEAERKRRAVSQLREFAKSLSDGSGPSRLW